MALGLARAASPARARRPGKHVLARLSCPRKDGMPVVALSKQTTARGEVMAAPKVLLPQLIGRLAANTSSQSNQ
ncbi:MAG: hypothetical protein U5K69_06000 [Balneolaceae bacterium]|nr:hypothetical protein [Balneolaceae bacterium]